MFGFRLASQLFHDGFPLFPFLPMGGGCQIHEGDGLAASGLLFQLGHGRLLGAVVDHAVNHAVIVLHGHLRIFQVIFREKSRNLLKTNTVNIVAGYHAVLLEGNNVADAHGRTMEVHRFFRIELLEDLFQLCVSAAGSGQGRGINQIIAAALHRNVMALQPVHIHEADILRVIPAHLVDSEAIALMGEKRLLPFQLPVLPLQHFLMELRTFLPFVTGHGKDTIMGVQIGAVKSHLRVFALLDDVHGQIALHQFIGPLFGEGQKVAVHVAALFQIVLGQRRVRHGVFVQRLLWCIGQLGDFRHSGLGRCLHLLDCRLLQGLDHGQRRIPNGLAAHAVHLTDFQCSGGQRQFRRIQLAAVQCPHGVLVVDGVVIACVAGLNVEVQPSV